ncbi:hypothetical protein NIES2135_57980 [Leptolyngbya boryana NIES-2135]|uniref:Uncharacterized protein n=1 Tax=Leptolyngbya boryana NIES-2135 TaxID=1973484 RepID=A0A1Z4JQI9_LEPBY|nr:hypothetical protein [Leptolyngbya boryana]ULP29974.1 hypothetical protein MCP04_28770 [Leptolyngbya boryana IU 594]BAS54936.1 hypothetical protein LBWT_8370 [Leptolyngbya boryana IAM M-101]BAS61284.1 hypothetical protein LBDG_08370 [Leptolyngbya boryana dg5]BAY58923.1 hypothetical protein NIES2135_57980 [Leptolyngbya boryana NIES-2135]
MLSPQKRDRLFVRANLLIPIMANLTKHQPVQWHSTKPTDYPVYRHNGTDYRLVPDSALVKLLSDKDGLFWFAVGMAAVAIAAATHVAVNLIAPPAAATAQPQIIEKPVIVTQEKVVPTNCLAFCNR